jgi:dienelactone hydrolase
MSRLFAALTLLLLACGAAADGGFVSYEGDGRPYEGYFAPAGNSRGLVLLLHDWDGLTDYEVKRADMLAALGYSVFAADLFGAGIRPTEVKDRRQHTGELYADRQKMRTLMMAALQAAAAQGADPGHAVAMGYCFGGAAVLELARAGADLRGFVTFHGGLGTPEGQTYEAVTGPVVVYHGSADSAISMAEFAELADRLETAGITHQMTTYGGAQHAFTVHGGERYQRRADEQSWAAFLRFLDEVL